jgi:hypothetical protein
MRIPVVVAGIGLASMISLVAFSQPQQGIFEVTYSGRTQSLDEATQLSAKFWLQQLMLSALYRDVVQDSSLDEWQQQSKAQSRIYCRYSSQATLAIPERRTLNFDEVLLPLPSGEYPAFVFVRHGRSVLRLAKYDPWVFHKLVSEAALPGYESLSAGVERALF